LGFEAGYRKVADKRNAFAARTPVGPRRFFFLGRISREKNLAFLAEAWTRDPVLRESPLTFIGDGPFRKELASAFAGLRAEFAGVVAGEDVPERICAMDFLVFPSGTDTLGQAVLESLCMGIPALVSDEGGPAELVETGANGFILPMNDLEAWIACLRRCAAMGPEEYATLSRNARERALSLDPAAAAESHWRHWVEASRPKT
jgi:glycosyltransferase involved in cell wall biosynthesis